LLLLLLLLTRKLLIPSKSWGKQLALSLRLLLWGTSTIASLETSNSFSCSIVRLRLTGSVLTPL
jgi:hypothetical protein